MKLALICVGSVVLLIGCNSPQSSLTAPTSIPFASFGSAFTVSGVVRDRNGPVAGVRVAVLEQRAFPPAMTDADGRYSIRTSAAQPWGLSPLVAASKAGYFADIRFTDANYLPISRDTELDFSLEPLTYVSLGEFVRARVGGASCSHWGYGTGSCARFGITVPASGTLEVTVTAVVSDFDIDIVAPDGTFAAYDGFPYPTGSPRLKIPVSAGLTYQIRLAGAIPRDFELATSLR
jgi:pre-peptidase